MFCKNTLFTHIIRDRLHFNKTKVNLNIIIKKFFQFSSISINTKSKIPKDCFITLLHLYATIA